MWSYTRFWLQQHSAEMTPLVRKSQKRAYLKWAEADLGPWYPDDAMADILADVRLADSDNYPRDLTGPDIRAYLEGR